MISLIIDTSHTVLAVGLADDNHVIDSYQEVIKKQHSEKLIPKIDELLKKHKLTVDDIQDIVVTEGPGSYTGTRVGITFAKVFAIAHPNVSIYTIDTLLSLVGNAKGFSFIDARSKRVFGAFVDSGEVSNERVYQLEEVEGINDKLFGDIHLLNKDDVSYPSIIKNIYALKGQWKLVESIDTLVPVYLK